MIKEIQNCKRKFEIVIQYSYKDPCAPTRGLGHQISKEKAQIANSTHLPLARASKVACRANLGDARLGVARFSFFRAPASFSKSKIATCLLLSFSQLSVALVRVCPLGLTRVSC
ncbi:hypothetical protein TIFTF001_018373 [Ficus carica]|uniref:Uncharacterized protein n=1 Tax=Ficus carica TaxID=3494 RepID=A0AA88AN73_FICCA|nr:hypothetical protein TIFTF001_018373 [Ficus carica]